MFRKRKIDVKLEEAKSLSEAINYIFIGVKWFLIHHTKKTIIVLLILFGSALYICMDYVQKSKPHTKRVIERVE